MPPPKPLLITQDFVLNLESLPMMKNSLSISSQPEFHAERLQLLDTKSSFSPDSFILSPVGGHPDAEIPRTYLQMACLIGDPLLLCEMIRAGATIDIKDSKGITGLYMALESLSSSQMALQIPNMMPLLSEMWARLEYIARVLVEQHADVNHTLDGITPLHLACKAGQWDLIALLLKHGANPLPRSTTHPATLLSSSSDRSRFSTLVKKFPLGRVRPERMCPCFSGRSLAACHAVGNLPHPPSLLCICASGKSYEKCCARRKINVIERWDDVSQRIITMSTKQLHIPNISRHQEDRLNTNIGRMVDATEVGKALGEPGVSHSDLVENSIRKQKEVADDLLSKGLMDPAYVYALKKLEFSPRPQGRIISKRGCGEYMERWNTVIDEYISFGCDKRPQAEIERAAKIGLSNGALYRRCEGANCYKVEGKNMQKALCCSRCKMAIYCSPACQKPAWKSHKSVCGSNAQREQALPSQEAMENHLVPMLLELATMDLTPPPDIQLWLDARRREQH